MSNKDIPVVIPGSALGNTDKLVSGEGTYVIGNVVFASVTGVCSMLPSEDSPDKVRCCDSLAFSLHRHSLFFLFWLASFPNF